MTDPLQDMAALPEKLRNAVIKFDLEAEKITSDFVKSVEAKPPPDVIYHYTDDSGLRGILENGNLRLTDIHNLNDPSELKHGYSHAIKIVNSRLAGKNPFFQRFANSFQSFGVNGGIEESQHCFVLCLAPR